MKKLITALALMLMMTTAAARADRVLHVSGGTVSRQTAQEIAAHLEKVTGEAFLLDLQEETGMSLEQRIMAGEAPQLAVVPVGEALVWAREGMLLPLDGCMPEFAHLAQPLADACVVDEQLMAAPLFARHRRMAVSVRHMEAARMEYLLDARAHPVWYPSEFLQALDELAMQGSCAMEVWAPQEGGELYLEAMLQGVSGLCLIDGETGAYAGDGELLSDALGWMEDMLSAGLIEAAQNREEALSRFLEGETAIFPDWTDVDSAENAQALDERRIVLMPYPSLSGSPLRAAELICVCAFLSQEEAENALLSRAAAALCGGEGAQALFGERMMNEDGAKWLFPMEAAQGGATLRALFSGAACAVIAKEETAQSAASRIDRAMRAMSEIRR